MKAEYFFKDTAMQKIPLNKKVKAIEVKSNKSVNQLLLDMSRTGFQGRKLAEAAEVMEKMIKEKKSGHPLRLCRLHVHYRSMENYKLAY